MDIPELVRELLTLRWKLKPHVKMSIHIDTETLSVRMWAGKRESWLRSMKLDEWHIESRDFLCEICGLTVDNNLVSEQQTLKLW